MSHHAVASPAPPAPPPARPAAARSGARLAAAPGGFDTYQLTDDTSAAAAAPANSTRARQLPPRPPGDQRGDGHADQRGPGELVRVVQEPPAHLDLGAVDGDRHDPGLHHSVARSRAPCRASSGSGGRARRPGRRRRCGSQSGSALESTDVGQVAGAARPWTRSCRSRTSGGCANTVPSASMRRYGSPSYPGISDLGAGLGGHLDERVATDDLDLRPCRDPVAPSRSPTRSWTAGRRPLRPRSCR